MQLKFVRIFLTVLFLPLFAQAQTFGEIFSKMASTANLIVGALFVISTVVFFWGVVKFIAASDNPQERQKAKAILWWGIIGMAVMASAWGIAFILKEYFQIGNQQPQFLTPPVLKSTPLPG